MIDAGEFTDCFLENLHNEAVSLRDEYDEKLITGLHYLLKGKLDDANQILAELTEIEASLTEVKACLEYEYRQVVSLH